jgi:demethylmenaquinone methyltransferase/2-methoxy-6-polyprenyl-1,4-benzoquinol methylase
VSLRHTLATPDAKARYVRRLFAVIANRYDLITVLLSFGLDRAWKRRLVDIAQVGAGDAALDLACGTGDLAFELSARGPATVVGLDITPRMIELAVAKRFRIGPRRPGPLPRFLVGDMMALPFPPAVFDIVTTGYGLRNVPVLRSAAVEIARVLRPGGRFLSLDLNRPASAPVRALYLSYLTVVGSALGWALHRDPDTYRYIPESIRRYPGARAVSDLLKEAGFGSAGHVPVLGGLMAIHVARK